MYLLYRRRFSGGCSPVPLEPYSLANTERVYAEIGHYTMPVERQFGLASCMEILLVESSDALSEQGPIFVCSHACSAVWSDDRAS